jgi:hypothetical protein
MPVAHFPSYYNFYYFNTSIIFPFIARLLNDEDPYYVISSPSSLLFTSLLFSSLLSAHILSLISSFLSPLFLFIPFSPPVSFISSHLFPPSHAVAGAFSSLQLAMGEGVAEVIENIGANWATIMENLSESTRGEL